jgi:hypothetical protein
MRRRVAIFWHAALWLVAGVLYFFFVLPRWPELTGDTSHGLGTAVRIVAGVLIALAALPVVFTLLRSRKPEFGTPALALTLLTASVVAHVLAGVLIVGAAISEIWLNLDNVGQLLFAVYGAAAAIAVLGIFGFYLSSVAELPPPPPKPLKPRKDKTQRRRGKKDSEAEAAEEKADSEETAASAEVDQDAEETADANDSTETAVPAATADGAGQTVESHEVESTAVEAESTADEAPAAEDAAADESSTGGLRNRRPTGKGSAVHRRRRSRRGVAVED